MIRLISVHKSSDGANIRLIGRVQKNGQASPIELYFAYPAQFSAFVVENADPFVAALLLPAMAAGEDLEIRPPVSKRLARNLSTIQGLFHCWYPTKMKEIDVEMPSISQFKRTSNGAVGAFFSLGVDSFYTLIKNMREPCYNCPPISHLIYMKGLEAPLSWYKDGRGSSVMSDVAEVAHETNKEYIIGETNIRDHFPLKWGPYYNGAGVGATALSLSLGFDYVLISSTYTYNHIFPWGSSPLVDHLWSNDLTTIVHHGSEIARASKIAKFLAASPLALRKLRVCVENRGGQGNCGLCWKCVGTMVSLHIADALMDAKTFPDRLPSDYSRRIKVGGMDELAFAEENLRLAQEYVADRALVKALRRAVSIGRIENMRMQAGKRPAEFAGDLTRYLACQVAGAVWRRAARVCGRAGRVASRLARLLLPNGLRPSGVSER